MAEHRYKAVVIDLFDTLVTWNPDALHHRSVILNGAVLLLNIAAIVGTAGALTPRG